MRIDNMRKERQLNLIENGRCFVYGGTFYIATDNNRADVSDPLCHKTYRACVDIETGACDYIDASYHVEPVSAKVVIE